MQLRVRVHLIPLDVEPSNFNFNAAAGLAQVRRAHPTAWPSRASRTRPGVRCRCRPMAGTRCTCVAPRAATREELLRVHTSAYVDAIAHTSGRGVALDADTFTSPESFEIALIAAGAAVQAAHHALEHREPAIALVRPPGHHAERDRAMGFCLFNNVAVAAASAVTPGAGRVAIVDIDVHHGNGTQWMFFDRRDVLYISSHQFPFYPGTGAATEIGRGAGEGYTINFPIEAGATDADYDKGMRRLPACSISSSPNCCCVGRFRRARGRSAGVDAGDDERLCGCGCASEAGGRSTLPDRGRHRRRVRLDALDACLDASLNVLRETPAERPIEGASPRADRTLAAVRAAQADRWRAL